MYIEPGRIQIDEASEGRSPRLEDASIETVDWPEEYQWAFQRTLPDRVNVIDSGSIREEIEDSIRAVFDGVEKVDSALATRMKNYAFRSMAGHTRDVPPVIHTDDVVILPQSGFPGQFLVMSADRTRIEKLTQHIKDQVSDLNRIAEDFGYELSFLYGRDFASSMSGKLDPEVIERNEFDNGFEERLHEELTSNLTRSVDHNVLLKFGENDPETFEFDFLVHATRRARLIVEAKDASHEGADLTKSDLIDTPRDKMSILEAEDNVPGRHPPWASSKTDCIVVVKGLDDHSLEQHRKKAKRRDITILSYEKEDYLEDIENRLRQLIGIGA